MNTAPSKRFIIRTLVLVVLGAAILAVGMELPHNAEMQVGVIGGMLIAGAIHDIVCRVLGGDAPIEKKPVEKKAPERATNSAAPPTSEEAQLALKLASETSAPAKVE